MTRITQATILAAISILLVACGSSPGANSAGSSAGFTPPSASAPVARATITGPIPANAGPKGHALWDSWYDLSELGYSDDEYFINGTALSSTGQPEAEYTTRFILRRPLDPNDFNGTLILDWVNVTAQFENPVDSLHSHDFLVEEGYAFAHVSVQAVGLCCNPLTPKTWDPQRYDAINHPGDDYAYNMLAQIAENIRNPALNPDDDDPMAGLDVERVIVTGQSQSANNLVIYVSEGFADNRILDGILIHSSTTAHIFDFNPPVPVFQLLSDFEARAPEHTATTNYRLWEIAGSAHQDLNVGLHQVNGQGPRAGASAPRMAASADDDLHDRTYNYGEQQDPFLTTCVLAGAAFPMRYSTNAAFQHLNQWLIDGTLPPTAPRYEFTAAGQLARDGDQNALGGIRLPPIVHPVARYRSTDCALGGITIPFTEAEIAARYTDHGNYFCLMQAATDQAVADGYLLGRDAAGLMARVEAASNRFLVAGTRPCENP